MVRVRVRARAGVGVRCAGASPRRAVRWLLSLSSASSPRHPAARAATRPAQEERSSRDCSEGWGWGW
eukprot:scaffold85477_cov75-Phaeocystis_antarctica.AAC.2